MRDSPRGTGHGKDRHKGVAREADGIEQERRVDLDIRVEWRPARLEARESGADGALDLGGEGEPPGARSQAVAELIERLVQERGARIAKAEDAMAEPDQPLAGSEFLLGPGGDVAAGGSFIEHVEGRAGSAAMQGPGEGAIGAERRGDKRGAARCDDPRGEGRGVEAVIDDGAEIGVERRRQCRTYRLAARYAQQIVGSAARWVGGKRR